MYYDPSKSEIYHREEDFMVTSSPRNVEGSSQNESRNSSENVMTYSSPELTHYGDISSLVQGFVVNMVDGPPSPPMDAMS